jgi:hypothetical protein
MLPDHLFGDGFAARSWVRECRRGVAFPSGHRNEIEMDPYIHCERAAVGTDLDLHTFDQRRGPIPPHAIGGTGEGLRTKHRVEGRDNRVRKLRLCHHVPLILRRNHLIKVGVYHGTAS